jgi:hypothetical protein
MLLRSEAVGKAAETVRAAQIPSEGTTLIDASSARSGTLRGVHDGGNQLEESTAASHSPINGGRSRGDRLDSAQAPKERRKRAMKGVLLIPAAVAVILVVLYLVTRRDDEGDDRGVLGVLIDLLRWW